MRIKEENAIPDAPQLSWPPQSNTAFGSHDPAFWEFLAGIESYVITDYRFWV